MEEARLLLKELELLNQEAKDGAASSGPAGPAIALESRFSSRRGKALLWIYTRFLCLFSSRDKTIQALEEKIESLETQVKELSKESEDDSTGLAFIIFNYVQVRKCVCILQHEYKCASPMRR